MVNEGPALVLLNPHGFFGWLFLFDTSLSFACFGGLKKIKHIPQMVVFHGALLR